MDTVASPDLIDPIDPAARARLSDLVRAIDAWDDVERRHLATAAAWIAGTASLYRTLPPDVPAMHLVSYFAVWDGARARSLLGAHRKARLWLPAGGHVEPGEDPWQTVIREAAEELRLEAVPEPSIGPRPFFLTVTPTRGPNRHTDVSLWYVLQAESTAEPWFDEGEFSALRWWTPQEILTAQPGTIEPHLGRFVSKLLARQQVQRSPARSW